MEINTNLISMFTNKNNNFELITNDNYTLIIENDPNNEYVEIRIKEKEEKKEKNIFGCRILKNNKNLEIIYATKDFWIFKEKEDIFISIKFTPYSIAITIDEIENILPIKIFRTGRELLFKIIISF